MLPWKPATPDQELRAGDRLLVAVRVTTGPDTGRPGPDWCWEYHTIVVTESGLDNSDGDTWISWAWKDVEWFISLTDCPPPERP